LIEQPLSETEKRELLQLADEAAQRAYAPYSNFQVGAVVLTDSGERFIGCNVENASYGLTSCAERNALFGTQINATTRPIAVRAVLVVESKHRAFTPCGACRQVMLELAPHALVYFTDSSGALTSCGVSDLLPEGFGIPKP